MKAADPSTRAADDDAVRKAKVSFMVPYPFRTNPA
jgi:hypothetical protein